MDYTSKLEKEKKFYNMYDQNSRDRNLLEIFNYWSLKNVSPRIKQVFGYESQLATISECIIDLSDNTDEVKILSLGCGSCNFEIQIAQYLHAKEHTNFKLYCNDVSEASLNLAQSRLDVNLNKFFNFELIDLNTDFNNYNQKFDIIICEQILHHVQELELLFKKISNLLKKDGFIFINDVIGKNGHQKWPESLELINLIYENMPEKYKYNNQLNLLDEKFPNRDYSLECNEGVRSQDVLPLLIDFFNCEKFVYYGGITDIFIEPAYGPNFNIKNESEKLFIDTICNFNEYFINKDIIKPTLMFGLFRAKNYKIKKEFFFNNKNPRLLVRHTSKRPHD
jgi:2-polyprenyl-3-methyl-5-hydroxy-6-metoxy-1,4-benzoquinol methylase